MRTWIDATRSLFDPGLACEETVQVACACCIAQPLREADEAPIPYQQYDLHGKYNLFNQRFFAGELPQIPLSFAKLKRVGGVVNCKTIRTGPPPDPLRVRLGLVDKYANAEIVPGSLTLRLSTMYQRSERQYDALLLHEMIHVYMFAVAKRLGEGHGRHFLSMLREISAKSGIRVPLTDDPSDLELTTTQMKTLGVVLVQQRDGRHAYAIVAPALLQANLPALLALWTRRIPYTAKAVRMFLITTTEWSAIGQRTRVQRKADSDMGFKYLSSEVALADLLTHGTMIGEVGDFAIRQT